MLLSHPNASLMGAASQFDAWCDNCLLEVDCSDEDHNSDEYCDDIAQVLEL